MLNKVAKFLFVATSLSPVLGAIAVNQYSLGKSVGSWLPWLIIALLLVLICWLLMMYIARNGQVTRLRIEQFENNDKEVLAFLLAYLLPFISSADMAFEGQWLTGAYILTVIFLVISHAGALHFNPVMGLLGYHFYGIKNYDNVSQLLISKSALQRPGTKLDTVMVAHNIYLHVERGNA